MDPDLQFVGGHSLAKHNNQMLFRARRKKKINENPLHPINSKNFVFVRFTDQAFKPLFFGNPNALTLSANKLLHALTRAQGSAPSYTKLKRDLEFTLLPMNSKYADCWPLDTLQQVPSLT